MINLNYSLTDFNEYVLKGMEIYTKEEIQNFKESFPVIKLHIDFNDIRYLIFSLCDSLNVNKNGSCFAVINEENKNFKNLTLIQKVTYYQEEYNDLSFAGKLKFCSKLLNINSFYVHLCWEFNDCNEKCYTLKINNNNNLYNSIAVRNMSLNEIIKIEQVDLVKFLQKEYLLNKYF